MDIPHPSQPSQTAPSTKSIAWKVFVQILFEECIFVYLPTYIPSYIPSYIDRYWIYAFATICFVFIHIIWGKWQMWTRLLYVPLSIRANQTCPYTSLIAHYVADGFLITLCYRYNQYRIAQKWKEHFYKNLIDSYEKIQQKAERNEELNYVEKMIYNEKEKQELDIEHERRMKIMNSIWRILWEIRYSPPYK